MPDTAPQSETIPKVRVYTIHGKVGTATCSIAFHDIEGAMDDLDSEEAQRAARLALLVAVETPLESLVEIEKIDRAGEIDAADASGNIVERPSEFEMHRLASYLIHQAIEKRQGVIQVDLSINDDKGNGGEICLAVGLGEEHATVVRRMAQTLYAIYGYPIEGQEAEEVSDA